MVNSFAGRLLYDFGSGAADVEWVVSIRDAQAYHVAENARTVGTLTRLSGLETSVYLLA